MSNLNTAIFIIFYSTIVLGHGGIDHSKEKRVIISKSDEKRLKLISVNYNSSVKEIFKRSCFDCHSSQTHFPFYYKLPLIRSMINDDISNAKKHLDFSSGFPFQSHDSPINDLKAIRNSIKENTMPPLRYKMFHYSKSLTEIEKTQVFNWIDDSLELLNEK